MCSLAGHWMWLHRIYKYMVRFGAVTPEKLAHFVLLWKKWIRINSSTFSIGQHVCVLILLARGWHCYGGLYTGLCHAFLVYLLQINLSRWRPQTGITFSFAHNVYCVCMLTISDSVSLWWYSAAILKCGIKMNCGLNKNSGIQLLNRKI